MFGSRSEIRNSVETVVFLCQLVCFKVLSWRQNVKRAARLFPLSDMILMTPTREDVLPHNKRFKRRSVTLGTAAAEPAPNSQRRQASFSDELM